MEWRDACFIALMSDGHDRIKWVDNGDYWGIFETTSEAKEWIQKQEEKDPLPKGMRYDIRWLKHKDA